jgi:hypothetical protein
MKTVSEETSVLPEHPNPVDLVPEVPEDEVSLVTEAEENPGFLGEFLTIAFGAAVGFVAAGFLNGWLMPQLVTAVGSTTTAAVIVFGVEVAGAAALVYFTRSMRGEMVKKAINGVSIGVAVAGVGTLVNALVTTGFGAPATSIRNAPANMMPGGITRRNRAITV